MMGSGFLFGNKSATDSFDTVVVGAVVIAERLPENKSKSVDKLKR